ncbi:hypothetical protein FQA47_025404 [Oryzias melastigma]|uniref:Uncharacterized protein n=1 Tax=Oryzias melastigma TaxID=30732 RepID=A0A834BSS7_ORYME|nr:hypothetical protein FQA47_025404 [Oryzias melastigma]
MLLEGITETKKRRRVPKSFNNNAEEETQETVPKKKNYRQLAAKRAASEILQTNDVQSSPMEEEVTALRRENERLQEQLSDLTAQVTSLKKEISRLRKMAVEGHFDLCNSNLFTEIPSLVGAVRTLISERDSAQQQHESTPSKSAALRNNVNVTDHSLVTAVHPRTPDSMSEDFTLAALRGKQTNTPASVPLGTDGDVMVSAHCWETARSQPTAKGMARTLLLGLFSVVVQPYRRAEQRGTFSRTTSGSGPPEAKGSA